MKIRIHFLIQSFSVFLNFFIISNYSQAQNTEFLYVIPGHDSLTPNGNNRTMNSLFVDSLFDYFEVTSYHYSFPGARDSQLAVTCDIHARGDIHELKDALEMSGLFPTIELQGYPYVEPDNPPVHIPENKASFVVRTYPNPVSEILYIEWEQKEYFQVLVSLYDKTGRKVIFKNASTHQGSVELNLNNLPSGYYILKVNTEKETLSKSIISKR